MEIKITWWKHESVKDLFWTFSRQITQLGSGEGGRSREGDPSFFLGSSKFLRPWFTWSEAEEEEEEEDGFEEEGLDEALPSAEDDGTVVESGESIAW